MRSPQLASVLRDAGFSLVHARREARYALGTEVLLVAPRASLANAQDISAREDAWVECAHRSRETLFGQEWQCTVGAPGRLHSDQDSSAEQEQEEAPAISTPDPWAESTHAPELSADEWRSVLQHLLESSWWTRRTSLGCKRRAARR